MNKAFKWMFAWFAASILTFVFASVFHSQFVLLGLTQINIDIPLGEWLRMTFSDMLGLSLTYGVVITFALLICFGTCTVVAKYWRTLPTWSYPLLGALTIAIMLAAMQPLLNVTLIAGARSHLGFVFQCLAGLIGGYVFARVWLTFKS